LSLSSQVKRGFLKYEQHKVFMINPIKKILTCLPLQPIIKRSICLDSWYLGVLHGVLNSLYGSVKEKAEEREVNTE